MNVQSTQTNFQSTTVTATYIILTWSQSAGKVVESYNISYSYHPVRFPPKDVGMGSVFVNGSLRQYNLSGLVHESMYNIQNYHGHRNWAGSSAPVH